MAKKTFQTIYLLLSNTYKYIDEKKIKEAVSLLNNVSRIFSKESLFAFQADAAMIAEEIQKEEFEKAKRETYELMARVNELNNN